MEKCREIFFLNYECFEGSALQLGLRDDTTRFRIIHGPEHAPWLVSSLLTSIATNIETGGMFMTKSIFCH